MERRGSKHLRIAATLELLMGAALIAGTLHNAWLNFKDKK